jgi:hypothetical protein
VDPVPDPLLLRKSGSAGNRTRASGSVAKNSDHQTTEAITVYFYVKQIRYEDVVWLMTDPMTDSVTEMKRRVKKMRRISRPTERL